MKKFLFLFVIAFMFIGCRPKDEVLEERIAELEQTIDNKKEEINSLNSKIKKLNSEAISIAENKEMVYYIVTFEARQTHFSLDLSEHLKDAANAYTFQVPVDKDFYNSVSVGQEFTRDFRAGSMLLRGTFGSNKITIVGKDKVLKEAK
jgi:uncharacterized coiled-coil protein SlyX